MLNRILVAVGVGVAVLIGCVLLGAIFVKNGTTQIYDIGTFMQQYAGLIGLLAAILVALSGVVWPRRPAA